MKYNNNTIELLFLLAHNKDFLSVPSIVYSLDNRTRKQLKECIIVLICNDVYSKDTTQRFVWVLYLLEFRLWKDKKIRNYNIVNCIQVSFIFILLLISNCLVFIFPNIWVSIGSLLLICLIFAIILKDDQPLT